MPGEIQELAAGFVEDDHRLTLLRWRQQLHFVHAIGTIQAPGADIVSLTLRCVVRGS